MLPRHDHPNNHPFVLCGDRDMRAIMLSRHDHPNSHPSLLCGDRDIKAKRRSRRGSVLLFYGFLKRLGAAVAWVNRSRRGLLLQLCASQVELANDVLAAKGGRTKH